MSFPCKLRNHVFGSVILAAASAGSAQTMNFGDGGPRAAVGAERLAPWGLADWCATPPPEGPLDGMYTPNIWEEGIVPYRFITDPEHSNYVTPEQREKMLEAFATLSAIADVQFIPWTIEQDLLQIGGNNNSGCSLSTSGGVGRRGGRQTMYICINHWNRPGILVHEAMHTLGLYHEHQRTDRDEYIEIHPSRDGDGNFRVINAITYGPYDFASFMHYGMSLNNSVRGVSVKPPFDRDWQYHIGRFSRSIFPPSNGDIWVLNHLYPGGPLPPRAFELVAPAWGEAVGSNWLPAFEWEESEAATGYRLLVDDSPLFDSPEIDVQTSQPEYTHEMELDPHRLYFWKVIASNDVGEMSQFPHSRYVFYTDSAYPGTLFVDDSAPSGGDGSNWQAPLDNLTIAVETAFAGEGSVTEIRVGQGVYTPDLGSGDRSMTFWLADGCALRGGFAGFDAPDPDARDIDLYETVLSGDLAGDDEPGFVNNEDNTHHIVISMNDSSGTEIDGFTLRGGLADGFLPGGSGVLIDASATVLRRCRFEANDGSLGAAIFIIFEGAAPTIEQCIFSGNRSAGGGGGASLQAAGPATFDACRFEDNHAAGSGGAVLLFKTEARFINCVMRGNSANYGGAAEIFATDSVAFTNCLFVGNRAINNLGEPPAGGAVNVFGSGTPTMVNCTFFDNSSEEFGGAVNVTDDADLQLVNCVLWGSDAPDGAEIHISYPGFEGGTVTVSHTDVAGGEAGVSIGEGGTLNWGMGNIDADPLFVDPDNGDYHLAAGSPVIDAGDNLGVPEGIEFDLDGDPRSVDDPDTEDTGVGGCPVVDMGPYEFQAEGGCCSRSPRWICDGDVDGDGQVNPVDSGLVQAAFGSADESDLCQYDVDCDGQINPVDSGIVQSLFGTCEAPRETCR